MGEIYPAVNNKNDNEALMNVTHEIKGNRVLPIATYLSGNSFTDKNKILLFIDAKETNGI